MSWLLWAWEVPTFLNFSWFFVFTCHIASHEVIPFIDVHLDGFACAKFDQMWLQRHWTSQTNISSKWWNMLHLRINAQQFDSSLVLDVLCLWSHGQLGAWWLGKG